VCAARSRLELSSPAPTPPNLSPGLCLPTLPIQTHSLVLRSRTRTPRAASFIDLLSVWGCASERNARGGFGFGFGYACTTMAARSRTHSQRKYIRIRRVRVVLRSFPAGKIDNPLEWRGSFHHLRFLRTNHHLCVYTYSIYWAQAIPALQIRAQL